MPKSQQTRTTGGKSKHKLKHKWRRGDGKQIAEQIARDEADRNRERRQLGRAADDDGASLFVIDTDAVGAGGLASSKKLAKRHKALRSEAILLPNANIPAIGSIATEHSKMAQNPKKRKRTQEQLSKQTQKVLGKTRAKARNATPGAGHLQKQKPKLEQYDLWGADLPAPEQREMQPTRKQVTYGKGGGGCGRQPNLAGKPSAGKLGTAKPAAALSAVAVEVADPGASYNPDPELHKELIGEALAQEVSMRATEKKLKHMDYNTQRLLRPKKGEMPDVSDMFMTDKEYELQALDTDRESMEAAAAIAEQAAKKPQEKLTVAQRNKAARHAAREKQLEEQRKQKKMAQDLKRIEAIDREVEEVTAEREARAAERAKKREERLHSTQRLGPHLYKEEVLATVVPLTEELKGSMRAAKIKGSLLTDRIRSLQKRNIIEVRSTTAEHKSKRRRYQLKTYNTKAGKIDAPPTIA